jgi:hypothetical protein
MNLLHRSFAVAIATDEAGEPMDADVSRASIKIGWPGWLPDSLDIVVTDCVVLCGQSQPFH